MTASWWRGTEFAVGSHLVVGEDSWFACERCGTQLAYPSGFEGVACSDEQAENRRSA